MLVMEGILLGSGLRFGSKFGMVVVHFNVLLTSLIEARLLDGLV